MFTRSRNLPPHGSEVFNRLRLHQYQPQVWGPPASEPLVVASVTVQWEWSADQAPWLVHFSDHPTGDREVKARWLSKCSPKTTTVGVQRAWPAFQEGAHRLGDPAKARERTPKRLVLVLDWKGTTFSLRMTRGAVNKAWKVGMGKTEWVCFDIVGPRIAPTSNTK